MGICRSMSVEGEAAPASCAPAGSRLTGRESRVAKKAAKKKTNEPYATTGKPHGRPCLLTPVIHDKIISAMRAGNYVETAAAFAGISKKALYNWVNRGNALRDRLQAQLETDAPDVRALVYEAQELAYEEELKKVEARGPDGEKAFQLTTDQEDQLDTLAIYRALGQKDPEWKFLVFTHALEKARANAQTRAVLNVNQAAHTQWQAAAWFLERTNPELWGRRDRVTLEGNKEKPVVMEMGLDDIKAFVRGLSPEQQSVLADLATAIGGRPSSAEEQRSGTPDSD